VTIVVDTGALIGFERGDRKVAAILEAARRRDESVVTSSGCVAQAWRTGGPRQALLSRLLRGIDERALNAEISRSIGVLCGKTDTRDVVDAHVALLANAHDIVLSSDPGDLRTLLRSARVEAVVEPC
jgi:hypothetical protein